jgi:hypothetical protein
MKFSESLGSLGRASSVFLQQIFRLIFEVIEVWIRGQASYWHNELPFVCPRSAMVGRKSVRETNGGKQVDFCPFRGPDAPFALGKY